MTLSEFVHIIRGDFQPRSEPEPPKPERKPPVKRKPAEKKYFNYIQAQAKVSEMANLTKSIDELDTFISDLQMYEKGNREGSITLSYTDFQGEEKTITLWLDGDLAGDSFSADILQDAINERDRRRERLEKLMTGE